jgi:hypothetical protein
VDAPTILDRIDRAGRVTGLGKWEGAMLIRLSSILTRAGRNGPVVLLIGVLVGLVFPSLAAMMRPLMGFGVFLFTLGAFLRVDPSSFRDQQRHGLRLASALLWTGLGIPLVMLLFAQLFRSRPDLMQGMLLCAFAPPVGSAAAIAAMLSLDASLALILSVMATLLSPLLLPLFASWFLGRQIEIDPLQMSLRLAVIVGGAAMVAAVTRRFGGAFVTKNPLAMTGIAVGGLIVVALGAHARRGRFLHGAAGPVPDLFRPRLRDQRRSLPARRRHFLVLWTLRSPDCRPVERQPQCNPGVGGFFSESDWPFRSRDFLRDERFPDFCSANRLEGLAWSFAGSGRSKRHAGSSPDAPDAGLFSRRRGLTGHGGERRDDKLADSDSRVGCRLA